jgi:hypothetical protein
MYQEYKDLLSAFHAHGVKYLVVGGYAVIFHAQPRFTRDIDLFIQANPENAQATYSALAAFGAPLQDLRPQDFAERGSFFRFGRDPHGIDILPDIPGVNFEEAWQRRVEGVIDPKSGLRAFFISAPDLIAAKLAAGRPQDIADAAAVRAAASEPPQQSTEKTRSSGPRKMGPNQ